MAATWNEYIDLLSNSSNETHPNNKNSDFTNVLPMAQDLPENSMVALEEFGYTSCFYNIDSNIMKITIWNPLKEWPAGNLKPPNPNKYSIYIIANKYLF